jgi:3-hydroxyisobutyrate dehydrogenase-like beta-hydroxyacid dehydrogenase
MTERLIDGGFEISILDPCDEAAAPVLRRGAKRTSSPKELGDKTEIVFLMLPTPEVVLDVAIGENGLVHGSAIKYCVDMGTTGSRAAIELTRVFSEHGIAFVDAPVTGAIKRAYSGTLSIMAAAPANVIEHLRPVFAPLGKVHHVGQEPGMGQTMKLINNMASAANMAITSEMMILGRKAGLDCQVMLDIMNSGSGRNSASEDKFPEAILPRTFDFGFPMDLQIKDLKLCMEEAERLRVPTWVSSSVYQLWFHWFSQGTDSRDFTTIIEMLENWTGVKIEHEKARVG